MKKKQIDEDEITKEDIEYIKKLAYAGFTSIPVTNFGDLIVYENERDKFLKTLKKFDKELEEAE